MQNQSKFLLPEITSKTRITISSVLFGFAFVASLGFVPYLILAAFLALQVGIRMIGYDPMSRVRHFREFLWVGPAKVLTALFMIMAGIPADTAGLLWIGLVIMLALSGMKDIYHLMSHGRGVAPTPVMVSARQKTKEAKTEEHLLADLNDFLGNSDNEEGTEPA